MALPMNRLLSFVRKMEIAVIDYFAQPKYLAYQPVHASTGASQNDLPSSLASIFDPYLYAVPKKRRSAERRLTRKMSDKKHLGTFSMPKKNLVACIDCGHWHESHTICGHCYNSVREQTRIMQESMGEDALKYNAPRQELSFLYDGEDAMVGDGDDEIVRVKAQRPQWFPRHLLKNT